MRHQVEVLEGLAEDEKRAHRGNVMTYQRRRPKTSPRSAAKTPIWQVNDDDQHQRHRHGLVQVQVVGGGGHTPVWARAVKYIANGPAKNINSLESHTMVPAALTMFGRFSESRAT